MAEPPAPLGEDTVGQPVAEKGARLWSAVAPALRYCDIHSNYSESLLQGQTVCGGAADSSRNVTQQRNSKAFIKHINKAKTLVARIDQMISDVGPIADVSHLDPP